jgi:hypothetical protein
VSGAPERAQRALAGALLLTLAACGGADSPAGGIEGPARSAASQLEAARATRAAAESLTSRAGSAAPPRQILFGDLHVHTTWSIDAFLYGLPLFGGEGAHPPADACDFARHCAGLDFFSLNDHAEGLTPERWQRSVESVRECNARSGDPANPDLVAFVGWEWTQMGETPETHFGHKNVMLRGLSDAEVPARPISALADDTMERARFLWAARLAEAALAVGPARPYADFLWWIRRLAAVPFCARDVDTRQLPADCHENAPTPERLFEKLAQWGGDVLVIPHGLAWGIHAPPGARLDVQIDAARRAPQLQRLIEVYSGHGSSEVFARAVAEAEASAVTTGVCPEPTPEFLPCCWQAGEVLRARCGELPASECEARVAEARGLALAAGKQPQWVIPDASSEEWLDCDQPRGDAFKPVLAPRAGLSAQAALAVSGFDEPDAEGRPARFRLGFIASSDTHSARAGSGYKQLGRKGMSDARGLEQDGLGARLHPFVAGRSPDPARAVASPPAPAGFRNLLDVERGASFLYPGGLVAVHATGRDRDAIWDALERREVYGTSGPRLLLWFDLTNAPGGRAPMGSEVVLTAPPRFEVRAVGSRIEAPGCADETRGALSAERLAHLCLGECHHPGDARYAIAALEVVRVRPQRRPGEPIAALIEDPWLRFDCAPDPAGCVARFEDPEFVGSGRDAVYYVRALQVPTAAVNGANLRTHFDAQGNAVATSPCYGDARTPHDDECLAPVQERAWSSPIFVDQPAQAPGA